MKHILTIAIFIVCAIGMSQNKSQTAILEKFVIAHNNGSEDAIKSFIEETYDPEVYSKINLKDHINFYNQIITEFGTLSPMIYKKVEESPFKLIVHLIKDDEIFSNKFIDTNAILVVEIDLNPKNPKYMPHGLGLGSLLCEQKKN